MKLLRTFWNWITGRTMREDFARMFPGQCFICSEHAFMIREMHLHRREVPYHRDCPEDYARWRS